MHQFHLKKLASIFCIVSLNFFVGCDKTLVTPFAIHPIQSSDGLITQLKFTSDSKTLVVVKERDSYSNGITRIELLDARTGTMLAELPLPGGGITTRVFPDTGQVIALQYDAKSSKYSSMFQIWDIRSGNVLAELDAGSNPVWDAGFLGDGQKFWTYHSGQPTLNIWDVSTKTILIPLKLTNQLGRFTFSPDGKKLRFTTYTDHFVIDVESGQEIAKIPLAAKNESSSSLESYGVFSPDGNKIVLYSTERKIIPRGISIHTTEIFMLDLVTKQLSWTLPWSPDNSDIISVLFLPDGTRFGIVARNVPLMLYDTATGHSVSPLLTDVEPTFGFYRDIQTNADGKLLVGIPFYTSPIAPIWNVETGEIAFSLQSEAHNARTFDFENVVLSPDGTIAAGYSGQFVVEHPAPFGLRIWHLSK